MSPSTLSLLFLLVLLELSPSEFIIDQSSATDSSPQDVIWSCIETTLLSGQSGSSVLEESKQSCSIDFRCFYPGVPIKRGSNSRHPIFELIALKERIDSDKGSSAIQLVTESSICFGFSMSHFQSMSNLGQ